MSERKGVGDGANEGEKSKARKRLRKIKADRARKTLSERTRLEKHLKDKNKKPWAACFAYNFLFN